MSNKSYTLADGSTVTVTATEQGIPFNEGMQALTKAIKARVAVRDGSSGSGGASADFFGISPSEVTVAEGESVTATVSGPKNANTTVKVTIADNLSWCSINGNVITIAPPVGTTLGLYNLQVIYTNTMSAYASTIYYPITVNRKSAEVIV